jgi:chaperonin GroES
MTNLKPLHDIIIAKRLEPVTRSAGGIELPVTDKPDMAKVVAIGPGKRQEDGSLAPLDVKVGDTIILGQYVGDNVRVNGEELLVMREEHVFAVME